MIARFSAVAVTYCNYRPGLLYPVFKISYLGV